jgi:hypothetical protein
LQDESHREPFLIEGCSSSPRGDAQPFAAVGTIHESYVEYGDGTIVLSDRRVDDEVTN